MTDSNQNLTIVDGHVHIYDCFDIPRLLDMAYRNFTDAAAAISPGVSFRGVLLLCEVNKDHWFRKLRSCAMQEEKDVSCRISPWTVRLLDDEGALLAERDKGEQLLLVAGRQIRTAEGLELLALAVDEQFDDGQSLHESIKNVRSRDAIPVIPWAVGKWLGKRGKILAKTLADESGNELYLGDNGGRPVFWRYSTHFGQARRTGMRILPGSDPLPLSGEEARVGDYGFYCTDVISDAHPVMDLKKLLRDKTKEFTAYGSLESPLRFFTNQLRLRSGS